MTSVASSGGISDAQDGTYDGSRPPLKEHGSRRKRLAGYLKAANELRQTYQQQYAHSWNNDRSLQDEGYNPADFPEAAVARGNDGEEMVIFPSYARRHIKISPHAGSGTTQEVTAATQDMSLGWDTDYWKRQWDKYENDKAIVDVDVRGWLYTPHSGPLNRKHRIFIGLARQMVGIAAPPGKSPSSSNPNSRSTSPHGFRERIDAHSAKHENEIVAKEAELILRKGHVEAEIAGEGKYSEEPSARAHIASQEADGLSIYGTSIDIPHNRDLSPGSDAASRRSSQQTMVDEDELAGNKLQHVTSWNNPSQMSAAELSVANSHLMNRLGPFLANPSADIPISAFFYNDEKSHSKTIHTNASGQFSFRAALDFIPTHVRVLAAEGLSVEEEVRITEPHGVSVISDIDDTIKHSAVSSGAREIFRNVFIRDLDDLTIDGVKDWYNRMADMGVYFHYVSNSPWQLFPLLTSFFAKAHLPAGSFHLKQYNGMLQGIFEPVAERKRSSLDKILHDFPERRFILIGDSGEADLEVYTEVVTEYPGRILGIFIRDITTPKKKGFFDSTVGSPQDVRESSAGSPETAFPRESGLLTPKPHRRTTEDAEIDAAIAASLQEYDLKTHTHNSSLATDSDSASERPALPRRPTEPITSGTQKSMVDERSKMEEEQEEEDLIDLEGGSDRPFPMQRAKTDFPIQRTTSPKPLTPPPNQSTTQPANSSSLRNETSEDGTIHTAQASQTSTVDSPAKTAPPRPRKPSTAVNPSAYAHRQGPTSAPMPIQDDVGPEKPPRPTLPPGESSYEKLPATSRRGALSRASTESDKPPLPARKPLAAVAASYASSLYASAASATSAYASSWTEDGSLPGAAATGRKNGTTTTMLEGVSVTVLSKREELWRRRLARAKLILEEKGVLLRTWRVGEDAEETAVKLIEHALKEDEKGISSLRANKSGQHK